MEHRWSLRTPVTLDVDLIYESASEMACKTRDIGLGGVFIEGDSQTMPPKNANVELNFILNSDDGSTKHKIKARVVRTSDDGIGLMFRDFDVGAFRSLQEVLRHKKPDSVH